MTDAVRDSAIRHRLSAILAADGVGYSRLMARDEVATVEALDRARAIFRDAIEARAGRVIDMAGDSVLATFDTAHGAVEAAIAIQASIDAISRDVEPDAQLRFRIGIHLGDVIEKADGTVYGDGVNIAARLEGLAATGGLVISQSVLTAVRGRMQTRFDDIGEQSVKNIEQPVRAYRSVAGVINDSPSKPVPSKRRPFGKRSLTAAIAAFVVIAVIVGILGWRHVQERSPANAGPDAARKDNLLSIVVLPFTNLSGDPSQAYVADGLTASITADLSRVRAFVIGTATALPYRDRHATLRQIGEELGVRFVLQGNVQRAGQIIRVNAELGDTRTDAQLWSDTFEGDATNLFALQDLITTRIGNSIGKQMVVAAGRPDQSRTTDASVADLLLRARALALNPRTEANSKRLIETYRQALALDPNSLEAAAGLGLSLTIYAANHIPDADHERQEKMFVEGRALAAKVREQDAQNVSAWIALGIDAARHGDRAMAQRARETRLALQPRNPGAYVNLSNSFLASDPAHAIELLLQAINLDPRNPGEYTSTNLGEAYFRLGDCDRALEWLRKDADKKIFVTSRIDSLLAMCYAIKGDDGQARIWSTAFAATLPNDLYKSFKPDANSSLVERRFWEDVLLPAWRKAGLPESDG